MLKKQVIELFVVNRKVGKENENPERVCGSKGKKGMIQMIFDNAQEKEKKKMMGNCRIVW